jgi:fatty-acyl-CoA synthase
MTRQKLLPKRRWRDTLKRSFDRADMARRWIDSAADLVEYEKVPYHEAVPVETIVDLLELNAQRFGTADALVYLQSVQDENVLRLSHDVLFDRVVRAGALFRQCGIGRADPVAIIAPHIPSTHIAMWGAQLAGCALPINYLLSSDHIAQLLRLANVKVAVILGPSPELSIHQNLREAISLAACVEHVFEIDADEIAPRPGSFQAAIDLTAAQHELLEEIGPDTVASIYHTGGTTGLPKLLTHTHRNEVHTSWFSSLFYRFGRGDRMLNGFPLFHVAGAFVYGLSALAAGGSLFIPTLTGMRNREFVASVWDCTRRYEVTHLGCVPTVLSALLNSAGEVGDVPVRLALTGGSPLPADLAKRFESAFGIPVRNIFGMTECVGVVSIEPAGAPRVPGSAGLPLPYTRVVAIPLDNPHPKAVMRTLKADEPGQLAIKGPHVSKGYVDRSLNGSTFTDDGWLLSGDVGHVDCESRVFVTGRAKDLIIRGAHNIDPRSIEEVVQGHADVLGCAAVGEPDAYAGEVPVVFVVLRDGVTVSEPELLNAIRPRIPEPPAVPRRIVVLESLPLTGVGKIYKPALRALAAKIKLEEMIATVSSDASFEVICTEASGRVKASIESTKSLDPDRVSELRTKLAELPIDIAWKL